MTRANQQGTPSEAEIAWLAGIIEGEGTLVLGAWKRNEKRGPVNNLKITVQVILYNTDAGIIKKALELLRRLDINPHVRERAQKPMLKPGGQGHYSSPEPLCTIIMKSLDDCRLLIEKLRPWFFGNKAHRADLILEYLDRRYEKFDKANGNKRQPYDQGDLEVVERFYRLTTRKGKSDALEGLLNEHEQPTPHAA